MYIIVYSVRIQMKMLLQWILLASLNYKMCTFHLCWCVHKVKKNPTKSSQPNSHIRWSCGVVSKPVFQGPSVSYSPHDHLMQLLGQEYFIEIVVAMKIVIIKKKG